MDLPERKKTMKSDKVKIQAASFRDPGGFLFYVGEEIYRQVNQSAKNDYDLLLSSGLYEILAAKGMLVRHKEIDIVSPLPEKKYRIIQPERVDFLSYPYEWCFSQLRDAALLTLDIQNIALDNGMSLKDANAYNIQFSKGRPVFIDTLSFEEYKENRPWIAYRQFCQHFLAPLALMVMVDVRIGQLARNYIDGIPLDLANSLLPRKALLNPNLLMHLHLHARAQQKYSSSDPERTKKDFPLLALRGLVDSLANTVRKLARKKKATEWSNYYETNNYSQGGFNHKQELVSRFLDRAGGKTLWDLGSNTGIFSRIASRKGFNVISIDNDHESVECSYLQTREIGEDNILPLLIDLTNPSPGIGWSNEERRSLLDRGPADVVMALALVHHLAISNNVPLDKLARFFSRMSNWLIVEFVPKDDLQAQRLIFSREDIFPDYSRECFEEAFSVLFEIKMFEYIKESKRILYLMRKIPCDSEGGFLRPVGIKTISSSGYCAK